MTTTPVHALQRYWRESHREVKAAPATAVTIALMREAGTPGTAVAREVGARLGWQVYDYELLERIANELGLRLSPVSGAGEREPDALMGVEPSGVAEAPAEANTARKVRQSALRPGGRHGHPQRGRERGAGGADAFERFAGGLHKVALTFCGPLRERACSRGA